MRLGCSAYVPNLAIFTRKDSLCKLLADYKLMVCLSCMRVCLKQDYGLLCLLTCSLSKLVGSRLF